VIAFAVNLVRIVVVLMILRFVVRFLAAVVQGYQDAPRREPATDMVRDRVCDTFLPRSRALVAIVDGREQHFCSPECRDRARLRLVTT
jgi:Na+-transporting methylmalonyl-CoA/oxaloacetate decarboxylase gamma subunit